MGNMKRIKLTKSDIHMLENMLYFETIPNEFKVRIDRMIKHSMGEQYIPIDYGTEDEP